MSAVGTENTYTPRLEELFRSFQLSPFLPSRIRCPCFLASDCTLNPSRCFVQRSAMLFFVGSSRFVLLFVVQVLCNLAGVAFELLLLGERSVFHSKFSCPRNSRPCTSQHGLVFVEDLSLSFCFVRFFLCRAELSANLLGPPVNSRLRTRLDVRFDLLDFFSAWVRFYTRHL